MNKYSVLTYILNDYEPVREINYDISLSQNVEFVLVTDNPNLTSNTWKIVYDPEFNNSKYTIYDKLMYIRYHPFKYVSNDICVKIDGSMQINKPLDYFIDYFIENEYDGTALLHPLRDTIYDEYRAWNILKNMPWEEIYTHYKRIDDFLNYDYEIRGIYLVGFSIVRNNDMQNIIDKCVYNMIKFNGHCTKLDQTFYSCFINTHFLNTKWLILSNEILNGEYISMFYHNSDIQVIQPHIGEYIYRNEIVEPYY